MQKTIAQLTVGDTITAVDGRELRQGLKVERELGPVTSEEWAPEGVKVSGAVTTVEHFIYPSQFELVEVIPAPVKVKRATRRTIAGITWVKQSEGNAEGGVHYVSENGRFELGTYSCVTTCDDEHPVRIGRHQRAAIQKAISETKRGDLVRGWDTEAVWAVRDGAKGYLCCGNQDHEVWGWGCYDIETGRAVLIPSSSTMRETAEVAAEKIADGTYEG